MNRLALIAATGFLALALTGCGGDKNKPAPTTNVTVQPATQPAGATKAPEEQK